MAAKKKVEAAEWMYEIISRPHVTEKATLGSEHGQVTFQVPTSATKPQIKQAVEVLFGVAGVKFGYHLSESVALNPYVIYYRNMHQTHDDEASLDDRDYFTAGLETNIVMGSGWMLSGGVRSTLGYKDYDSLEMYFGTKFVF